MCDIINTRTRINQILNAAILGGFGDCSMKTDALVQQCFCALQAYYGDLCIEEGLKRKAEEFVAAHLARSGEESGSSAAQRRKQGAASTVRDRGWLSN